MTVPVKAQEQTEGAVGACLLEKPARGNRPMIPIEWYPRPALNTRVCVHGTADQYNPWGFNPRQMLEMARSMGCWWVKGLSCEDGVSAEKWVGPALDMGMMPIVRLYSPMPYRWAENKKAGVKRLIAMGVRYYETINEPGNRQEWHNGPPPANWATIAAENMIPICRDIQAWGGIPLIPALSTGSPMAMVDLCSIIIDLGGADIFDGPVVLAEHNYPLNHPIGMSRWGQSDTYPRDSVNQQGHPVDPALFAKVGAYGWGGRTLEWVNERRLARMNPDATMWEDNTGEISYRFHAALAQRTLEERIPGWEGPPAMIVTEGGFVIGDSQDDRYARNGPYYVRDGQVEMAHRCMGTSTEHGGSLNYPDHLLAGLGGWLINNDGGSIIWQSQAWTGIGALSWPANFREGDKLFHVRAMQEMEHVHYGTAEPPDPPPVIPDPPDPPPPLPDPPPPTAGWEIPPVLPQIYPVRIEVDPGTLVYRLISAKGPFKGRHWITVDVLDRFGKRKVGTEVHFESAETHDIAEVPADKPLDFPMYGTLGSYELYVQGFTDAVMGLGLGSAADPVHSHHFGYEFIFQEVLAQEEPEEPPPTPPDDMVQLVPALPESRVQDWRHRLPARVKDLEGVPLAWPLAWTSRLWLEDKARTVKGLAIHWAAADGYDWSALEIAEYQTGQWAHFAFSELAYHFVVRHDGTIEWGLPLEDDPRHVGAEHSIEWLSVLVTPVLYVDGEMWTDPLEEVPDGAEVHFYITPAQVTAAHNLTAWIGYGINRPMLVKGHREISPSECPGPDMAENLRRIRENDPALPGSEPPAGGCPDCEGMRDVLRTEAGNLHETADRLVDAAGQE